jgi:hypothetical protein
MSITTIFRQQSRLKTQAEASVSNIEHRRQGFGLARRSLGETSPLRSKPLNERNGLVSTATSGIAASRSVLQVQNWPSS